MKKSAWLSSISPRLNAVWRGHWKSSTVEPGRYLYDHELVLVSKGACLVQVGEKQYNLLAGTFLIIAPGILHSTLTAKQGVYRFCLHFDWTRSVRAAAPSRMWVYHPQQALKADLHLAPSIVPKTSFAGNFNLKGPILPLLETLFYRARTGSEEEYATCSVVLQEILLRLLWKKSYGRRHGNRATQLAYAVKEVLDASVPGAMPIQDLLPTLGFSYEHLCRLFKAKFGLAPVRYLNTARLERAKIYLLDPRKTVGEAAYDAGFTDPAYFSRLFRRHYRCSPRAFRES